jgi:hypothetical protein
VGLDPGARSRCFCAAIAKDLDDPIVERGRFACGEDPFELLSEVLGWGKAVDGYVPDFV